MRRRVATQRDEGDVRAAEPLDGATAHDAVRIGAQDHGEQHRRRVRRGSGLVVPEARIEARQVDRVGQQVVRGVFERAGQELLGEIDRAESAGSGRYACSGPWAGRSGAGPHGGNATPPILRPDLPNARVVPGFSYSFVGRKNTADDAPVDDPLFQDPAWRGVPGSKKEQAALKSKARAQLGTVGSGNHYVDVFADEAGTLWVGVHFGSRGFGHAIASGFLALGQGKAWGERAPEREVLLDLETPLGHDYWHLMNLAGRYAYAGREWVARKVVALMGGRELQLVHNHHNFAWREEHTIEGGQESVVVVRKGSTPAFPGQLGFVGGSMGDDAVIVRGVAGAGEEVAALQQGALYSTVHGAGRVMSRTAAAGKRNRKTGQLITPGRITPDMMHDWLAGRGVILRGGGLDEAPQAYRRLPDVLAAQEGTVEVLHTLTPLIVVMAGADEFDPYKD